MEVNISQSCLLAPGGSFADSSELYFNVSGGLRDTRDFPSGDGEWLLTLWDGENNNCCCCSSPKPALALFFAMDFRVYCQKADSLGFGMRVMCSIHYRDTWIDP